MAGCAQTVSLADVASDSMRSGLQALVRRLISGTVMVATLGNPDAPRPMQDNPVDSRDAQPGHEAGWTLLFGIAVLGIAGWRPSMRGV